MTAKPPVFCYSAPISPFLLTDVFCFFLHVEKSRWRDAGDLREITGFFAENGRFFVRKRVKIAGIAYATRASRLRDCGRSSLSLVQVAYVSFLKGGFCASEGGKWGMKLLYLKKKKDRKQRAKRQETSDCLGTACRNAADDLPPLFSF